MNKGEGQRDTQCVRNTYVPARISYTAASRSIRRNSNSGQMRSRPARFGYRLGCFGRNINGCAGVGGNDGAKRGLAVRIRPLTLDRAVDRLIAAPRPRQPSRRIRLRRQNELPKTVTSAGPPAELPPSQPPAAAGLFTPRKTRAPLSPRISPSGLLGESYTLGGSRLTRCSTIR